MAGIAHVITPDSATGAQVIDGSLKFDSGTKTHLTKTFSSSGNRQAWTWSGWVKRSGLVASERQVLFGGYEASSDTGWIEFGFGQSNETDDSVYLTTSSISQGSSAVFRDISGWYHYVANYDGSNVKIYINNVLHLTREFSGARGISGNWVHTIGKSPANAIRYFNGHLSQCYFIDGQTLTPSYFGFTDSLTNTWKPKKLEGVDLDGNTFTSRVIVHLTHTAGTVGSGVYAKAIGNVTTLGSYSGDTWTATNTGWVETWDLGDSESFTLSSWSATAQDDQTWYYSNDSGFSSGVTGPNSGTIADGTYSTTVSGTKYRYLRVQNAPSATYSIVGNNTLTGKLGTNGFYLPLDGNSPIGEDKSGQGNDWTQNNFSGTSIDPDVVKDSPSGAVSGGRAQTGITTTSSAPANYCIWNPLRKGNLITLSDGNLQAASTSGSKDGVFGTIGVSSGKYYWEVELTATDGNTNAAIGVALGTLSPDAATPTSAGAYFYSSYNGNKWLSSADSSYGDSYTTGDVVGVALDLDNTTLTFYKNGTSQGNATTSLPSGTYMPYVGDNANNGVQTVVGNWGQKPFKYAPPQGFLPLNYASVRPETVITRPDQYVGITTYTGTNASTRTISTEFEADLVWIKSRNMTRSNVLYDTVRGATKKLLSNDTGAEQTDTDGVKAFLENGVTIGNAAEVGSEQGYVMWHWKAGGGTGITTSFWKDDVEYGSAAAAGLDGGAINPAGASVGTKQGFSIIYQHDLTVYADSESSHGLSQTPDFIISKNRRAAGQWDVYHSGLTSGKRIRLNQTTAEFTPNFSNTDSSIKSVSSSTFTFVANSGSGNDIIHYIWHDVPGLQKFGSYTYTGNRPFFVELGFKPAVLWLKRTGSGSATNISYGSWFVADKERGKFNPVSYTESQWLNRAKASGKRGDGGTSAAGTYLDIDLVSNGFVIPTTGGGAEFNQPSDVVVYCAWAEAPASNLFGGQSTGR